MEMKEIVYKEAFCMFSLSYNQGLKSTRDAPSILLVDLRALEVDYDDEEVRYGEDDNPLPKGAPHLPSRLQGEGTVNKPLNDLVISGSPPLAASVTHFTNQ